MITSDHISAKKLMVGVSLRIDIVIESSNRARFGKYSTEAKNDKNSITILSRSEIEKH